LEEVFVSRVGRPDIRELSQLKENTKWEARVKHSHEAHLVWAGLHC
jgi:hypothetical protein